MREALDFLTKFSLLALWKCTAKSMASMLTAVRVQVFIDFSVASL